LEHSENHGGPVSLEDYCAMKQGKFVRRQKVHAVPHAGGAPQPGVVVKANEADNSVDVLFKNGNHDMNIPASDVSPRETPKAFAEHADSACIVEGTMTQVQKDVDDAYDEIKAWLKKRDKKVPGAAEEEDKAAAEAKAKAEEAARKKLAATKREEQAAEEKLKETQDAEAEAEKELKDATNAEEKAKAEKNLQEAKAKENEQKEQLGEIEQAEKDATNEVTEAQNKDVANAGNVEKMADGIARTIKELEEKREDLKKKGELDPDLRASMDEVLAEAKQARSTLRKVGEAEEKGGSHLVAEVEEAEAELKDAKNDMQAAEAGIYPSGDKWWRFRYEFSYVEAMFAILLSFLALIGETALHSLRKLIQNQSKNIRWQDERTVPTMYLSWFRYLGSEGLVLLWMNLAVWLLWVTVPWVYESWCVSLSDPYMHLPTKKEQFKLQAWETAVHLTLAMILYFLAIYVVVYHASQRLKRWAHWSSQSRTHSQAALTHSLTGSASPRLHHALSVSVIGNVSQMTALRSMFLSEIRMRPDLMDFASRHKVTMTDDFPFFLYLSLCMNKALQDVFVVKIWTWVFILLIFCVFALCHRFLHLGTAELLCVFGASMIIIFGVMIYGVLQAIEKVGKERHRLSDSARAIEITSVLDTEKRFEHLMCSVLQLIIFFLCFGAVRLIFSYWMWRLHFWYTVLMGLALIAFSLLWIFFLAPLISAFMAVICVPPYIHTRGFEKTIKIMRPPEMTPAPPDEIGESVERIDGLVQQL
jgi:hypothetical protein